MTKVMLERITLVLQGVKSFVKPKTSEPDPRHTVLLTQGERCEIFNWRTVKYEHIFLHDFQSGREVKQGLHDYFQFYNHQRLHQSLDYKTPVQIYRAEHSDTPNPADSE